MHTIQQYEHIQLAKQRKTAKQNNENNERN